MDKITKALDIARTQRTQGKNKHTNNDDVQIDLEMPRLQEQYEHHYSVPKFTPDALTLEKHRILNNASRDEIVQPYKVLRTRLMHIMQEKHWSSIAVLSPTKDDGKTTVAINLAISIGNSRKNNAVLLDLDLLTPSIYSCYGFEPEYGLEDYFEHEQTLSDILISPDADGLIIAPSIRPLHDSSEYLSTSRGQSLINEAKGLLENSIVVVDLPPILASDDAISFLPHIDAVLLIVREGKTNKQDIQRALEMLEGVNIAGVVINDSLEPATLGYY